LVTDLLAPAMEARRSGLGQTIDGVTHLMSAFRPSSARDLDRRRLHLPHIRA
jgi:hypothetical protein